MLGFKEFILESEKEELPPELGTTPIPEGHVRLFHYTNSPEAVENIKKHGILLSKAESHKYGDPQAVWASDNLESYKDILDSKPGVVEFHIPKKEWEFSNKSHIFRSIEPNEILHIHEPWHRLARLILSEPDTIKSAINGEFHDLNDKSDPTGKDRKAISYVKSLHNKEGS